MSSALLRPRSGARATRGHAATRRRRGRRARARSPGRDFRVGHARRSRTSRRHFALPVVPERRGRGPRSGRLFELRRVRVLERRRARPPCRARDRGARRALDARRARSRAVRVRQGLLREGIRGRRAAHRRAGSDASCRDQEHALSGAAERMASENPRARATVLNVNDRMASRYLVTQMLRTSGFDVTEAPDGTSGLALAREAPDAIVLDVNLPDLSGYEVCRLLKAAPETQSIPVLLTSAARTASEHRVEGLEAGADAYLVQPFESSELSATVRA